MGEQPGASAQAGQGHVRAYPASWRKSLHSVEPGNLSPHFSPRLSGPRRWWLLLAYHRPAILQQPGQSFHDRKEQPSLRQRCISLVALVVVSLLKNEHVG